MVLKALRDGAAGGIMKYFLFGLLIMAVGGLVMMDVGGFFRGGVSGTDVGKVGSEKIKIVSFDRTVRRSLARVGISPQEAFKLGYINELLNNEMRASLTYQSAREIGINVSRERIAGEIRKIVEPMVQDGRNAQEVLDQILLNQGMSEMEFVKGIEREVSGNLLSTALQNGFSEITDAMVEDLYAFQNEQRNIELILFPDSDLKDIEPPSDDEIEMLYNATMETYAQEERRTVSLLSINDEKLKKTIDISEEDLKQAYEQDIDLYTTPQQREFEQAILQSEEDAQSVYKKASAGTSLKTAVKDVTGEEKSYLEGQYFEKEGLLPEISDVVFNAQKGDVIGPVKTALGWHVMALKEIKQPAIKSYDSVKKQLEDEFKQIRLADELYELANTVDDMLAGGARPEDVAGEVDLDIKEITLFNRYGQAEDGKDALEGYDKERAIILETAFELLEGETSAVMEMANGKFMAVYVGTIKAKTYEPIEDVRGKIEKRWLRNQRSLQNRFRVVTFISDMDTSGKNLAQLAQENGRPVQILKNIKRQEAPPEPLNQESLGPVFNTPVNGYTVIDTQGGTILARIKSSALPALEGKEKEDALLGIHDQAVRGAQNEAQVSYFETKRRKYKTLVNQKLLNQVYGTVAESY